LLDRGVNNVLKQLTRIADALSAKRSIEEAEDLGRAAARAFYAELKRLVAEDRREDAGG
jgi:hypothetical protein